MIGAQQLTRFSVNLTVSFVIHRTDKVNHESFNISVVCQTKICFEKSAQTLARMNNEVNP
jgi:ABC-type transporter Mla maintaining outer membrane lipid asymmetry ATPase subunit MlaF